MKLYSIDRTSSDSQSFSVRKNSHPYFLKIWHFHPELELVYILKSDGTRFIGDSITKFEKGDLVLIGKNLPHMWLNDPIYFEENSKLKAEAIAIHFKEDFLGKAFFNTPEMNQITSLLKKSRYGISFSDINPKILKNIKKLLKEKGFKKTILFLTILNQLSKHKNYSILTSKNYVRSLSLKESRGLNKIYEYLFENFSNPIKLEDVAAIANMNPSAFSRYFKRTNGKTLTKYINEIRIGYACRKLIEDEISISETCYECGYNSISNFNKQFKAITNLTPSEYIIKNTKITFNNKN